jgi:predicted Zn-dependent protease
MFLAFLIAAAQPDQTGLTTLAEADTRLVAIGRRLSKGGAGLCGGAVANPGWTIEDAEQFAPPLRPQVRAALMLGDYPTVVAVEPGSAADKAGVRASDELLAIGTASVSAEPSARSVRARQEKVEQATATALGIGPTKIRVRREGRAIELTVTPEPGCTTEFLIGRGRGLRAASSNGHRVVVSAEIIDFTHSDDELALVLAHEMAHNILGHNREAAAQRIAGADRSGARSKDHEREADRWALYLAARAGFDPGAAPGFWRRWGPKATLGILSDGSHPDWRDRAARAENELARIRTEQAAGRALIP